MTAAVFSAAANDVALDALFVPFTTGVLSMPADRRVLFLRARDGFRLREMAQPGWLCQQSFKPFADALIRAGLHVSTGDSDENERYPLVLILPPRQRDEARALFARAVQQTAPGGVVLASMPNTEGAKSGEADLTRLAGAVGHLSKHKCRVFWTQPLQGAADPSLLDEWLALDVPRQNAAGYVSRPGLFAWDRVDTASALLAAHLPATLSGRVADLGAGYGYLSAQVLARCPQVSSIDLYEAEARALAPARINLANAVRERGNDASFALHWHDVASGGLPQHYDAIVSNPPFHQGRADLPDLGRAFIHAAADALQPGGSFWLVANRHLPYEATLSARFSAVHTVAIQEGFKVIQASGVRV
ncbi:class I SAM-dependent methyltransferase [Dyella tabacisoli]|uniref:Class I SAM-dependent methyltransferase n=1 Tax=Dyella tabacisoli TaxID=2282381 RepID=A0A369UM19_9GAMM|nr:class I SAM-dependent methyltransferase [Dyella tabacisoli]RDD81792.1 class I SAM-dependent methyltransferase [Dyella tabacisoli]